MSVKNHLEKVLYVVAVTAVIVTSSATTIRGTQEELIAWVDTKKSIAQAQANWMSEKIIVEDLIRLLELEKEKLSVKIDKLETTSDATDKLRTQLNFDKEALLASTEALESVVPKLESQIKKIVTMMPNPLLEEISPLLLRLPEDGKDTRISLSQRILTVVGTLNKIDKFNSGITVTSEIRTIGSKSLEVKTLYYGLAGAYFASESAGYAGIGVPSDNGWIWSERPELSNEIVNLIETYEGAREATFVKLPVVAQ